MNTVIVSVKLFPAKHKKGSNPINPPDNVSHSLRSGHLHFSAGDGDDCGILTARHLSD